MGRHIYFDLDGTLTDPFDGITRCIAYALEKLGVSIPDEAEMHALIGPPLQVSFVPLVGKDRVDEAVRLYRERFDDVGWQENVRYPGILELLAALRSADFTLFVATTKPWPAAGRIIEHFGMGEFFENVYGSELDGTRIDKTDLLAWAIPQNREARTRFMIGDRKHDMIGASNNGMQRIGVSYGYGSVEELQSAGAQHIVDEPGDILSAVA